MLFDYAITDTYELAVQIQHQDEWTPDPLEDNPLEVELLKTFMEPNTSAPFYYKMYNIRSATERHLPKEIYSHKNFYLADVITIVLAIYWKSDQHDSAFTIINRMVEQYSCLEQILEILKELDVEV